MSQATSETPIQVSCAVDGCFWKGNAADAPLHDCPTPEADVEDHPFAGMMGENGKPIAEVDPDLELPFHVVWTAPGGEELVRIGTRATEDAAIELAGKVDAGKGEVTVAKTKPTDEELAQAEDAIGADSEPEDRAGLEAWLVSFGDYDDQGVPQDEKTARLDAKLSAMVGDEGPAAAPDPEPEPDLDEPEGVYPQQDPASLTKAEPETVDGELVEEPWEIQVATELEAQGRVAEYRWLVVDTAAAEIVGRAKVKKDAEEILSSVQNASPSEGLQVVKTQALMERAEELQIEKRREMVPPDEPIQVDATPAAEPTPEPEPSTEEEKPEEPKTEGNAGGLFDASDFDREDLQIPKIDGNSIDKIRVDFGGSVMLDRSNPDHVAVFNKLLLGETGRMTIDYKGSSTGAGFTTNKDGDLDAVVGKKAVKVERIQIKGTLVGDDEGDD